MKPSPRNPTESNGSQRDMLVELAEHLLEVGGKDIPKRERRIIERVAKRLGTARDIHAEIDRERTFGQRLADGVARVGGSWTFIIVFGVVLVAWAGFNSYVLVDRAFDPYPYVFLNLLLSMLAAIQAPVIMMSQNRQAARDRLAAEHDYEVNLRAEIEIVGLHEKLDRMRTDDLKRLIEHVETLVGRKESEIGTPGTLR
jgi:uncharacterized membrane protein